MGKYCIFSSDVGAQLYVDYKVAKLTRGTEIYMIKLLNKTELFNQ